MAEQLTFQTPRVRLLGGAAIAVLVAGIGVVGRGTATPLTSTEKTISGSDQMRAALTAPSSDWTPYEDTSLAAQAESELRKDEDNKDLDFDAATVFTDSQKRVLVIIGVRGKRTAMGSDLGDALDGSSNITEVDDDARTGTDSDSDTATAAAAVKKHKTLLLAAVISSSGAPDTGEALSIARTELAKIA